MSEPIPTSNKGGKDTGVSMLLLTNHHAMKVYWENGGIAPLIL
jgi:hypothetical protein